MNVPERFNFARDVVEAFPPDGYALTFVDAAGDVSRLTWGEVAAGAARWSGVLAEQGLRRGDRLLVLVGKTPDWHLILLGALRLGVVTIPCSEMLRAKDLEFRMRHSGAALLVAHRGAEAEVAGMDALFLDEAAEPAEIPPCEDTAADEPAFILYTSGTTKDPKGVTHTHAYTYAKRMQAEHWLDARPGDLVWCTAGTGWAKSIWNVFLGPWSRGAEILLHEGGFDARERFELLERLDVTVLCQAPTEYRLMAKLDGLERHDLSGLRHAVSAGEPLNPEVIKAFRDAFGITIYDGYGQTENTLLVANTPRNEVRPGSMGLPTPGHDVAVIDERGERGAGRRRGRHRGARAAAEPVRRLLGRAGGDRGRVPRRVVRHRRPGHARRRRLPLVHRPCRRRDPLGRLPDRPVRGRERPARAPGRGRERRRRQAGPGARPDREGVRRPAAGSRAGRRRSRPSCRQHCKRVTAPYKYPREIEFVDALPKTRSGKIRRVELRQLEEQRAAS